jgi:hypothetical protein
MKTLLKTEGAHSSFIIAGLDPVYFEVVRSLEFDEIEEGFAKVFPAV